MHFPSLSTLAFLYASSELLVGVVAQDRTTEQGEASIDDPTQECSPYSYAPVSEAKNSFPPIWQPATILSTDSVALDLWQSIEGRVLTNISVKGSITGHFTSGYPSSDPDCWWTYNGCVVPKHPNLSADIADVPEPSTLGYGFDDGPSCSHNTFYDYLASKNQKATMFFIGSNVMDYPLEAQRALVDGHEICVHTWSHNYMTGFSSQDAFAELYYSLQAIKLVVGVTPTCWRPPYGDVDDRIRSIASALGLRTILWKYDSNDWMEGVNGVPPSTIDANYQSLINDAKNGTFDSVGAIMLTHELNNFTMSEAVKFYDQLSGAFDNIVPVGVAYNITQPYVETNYSMPTFQECKF
ncbi:carbohydrate esterase family 4 protein [Dendrothele bispora CBS 962.96]|uniref:chitin deacetylase n=1 Tax=Dendrothele bispora (strain CBS 962.96) TaxID=1314807 RepID=A0A4S8LA21_DENBC|nr:carbohydrate esterase family 4 protein [Dendrothele bispora CBS 962.96]